jgi:exodeoxyribonuclease V beta subunit
MVDCKPKKDGTLGDSGLHSSALAWLGVALSVGNCREMSLGELAVHLQTLAPQGSARRSSNQRQYMAI